MIERSEYSGPVVTVLIPTFNGRAYLPAALGSAVEQTYRRLQIIVVNDGGESVRDIVRSFNDSRIILLERKDNRGKAYSLNEGLEYSEGKYVAYLDDDDVHYPHHVQTLVDLLEGPTDCAVGYSDLYRTYCRILPDGAREVLGKVVAASCDFDRRSLFGVNHVPLVSMMHRTDLLDRTGPYNESVRVLIGRDMGRRMAFYSDFAHTNEITGEVFGAIDRGGRPSQKMGLARAEYTRDLMTIRTTRPPKPWPKVEDLSIVFAPEKMDQKAKKVLRDIGVWTITPYRMILPLPLDQLAEADTEMPNVLPLPAGPGATRERRIDQALKVCEGQYVALVPESVKVEAGWVEAPMHALMNSARPLEAIRLGGGNGSVPPAVFRKHELAHARAEFPEMTVAESAKAAKLTVRGPEPHELPFPFDKMQSAAECLEGDGECLKAAALYEQIARQGGDALRMKQRAAQAFCAATGHDDRAMELCRELNGARPTVDSLFLEAKLHRSADRIDEAVTLLEKARITLQRRG